MAGKLKPVTDALTDALDSAATHGRRVVDLPKKHKSKLDDDLDRRKDTDRDAADGATPSSGGRPDVRRPEGMSPADYRAIIDRSVHNPDAPEAVLGKFMVPGTPSYIEAAEGRTPPATYFSLGDEWGKIADAAGLDDAGMFDAFNVPFLDRIIAEGKDIHFSHNPLDFPNSALADELKYLQDHGYVFDPSSMQAIRL